MKKLTPNKKRGAALVEYGLLIAGVALICAAAVSLFGHKTNDMVGTVAGVLPSSDETDTGTIRSGKVIRTVDSGDGIEINWDHATSNLNTTDSAFGSGAGDIITDASQD